MATAEESPKPSPAGKKSKPPKRYIDWPWIPRFWDGMSAGGWFSLLVRNRLQVSPVRWAMAILLSFLALLNAVLWWLQNLFWGRRIAATPLAGDPIFVIGHWRSGTTLLHELLVLDPRHTYPNTFDCFAPNHFLLSAPVFRPLVGLLMPKRRPMDNMAAGWDRPQEDEFALCNMGLPSPYLTIAFANRPPQYEEYFEVEQVPPQGRAHWQERFRWFLQCLSYRSAKRVVLKSPPHTFRVKILLEMFPKARFIHIVRDPYVLFPSTVHLWKKLYRHEGLQVPKFAGLDEYVFETLRRMYQVFERDRALIPEGQLCEVRYEQLVADPLGEMQKVYEQLGLGEFDQVRPALEAYFADQAEYKTNRYEVSPELRAEIGRRWGEYFRRYGYSVDT